AALKQNSATSLGKVVGGRASVGERQISQGDIRSLASDVQDTASRIAVDGHRKAVAIPVAVDREILGDEQLTAGERQSLALDRGGEDNGVRAARTVGGGHRLTQAQLAIARSDHVQRRGYRKI